VILIKWAVKKTVEEAIKKAVADDKISNAESLPHLKIEYPRDEKFGDYSTPFALECARILKQSPLATGELLKPYIEESEIIDRVDVVKPGFINLFISRSHLASNIAVAIEEDESFGSSQAENKKSFNIEFVSANPTGPLNIVSARAAALGDSLANILTAAGHSVGREFYVNDYGNQVNLFGLSVYYRFLQLKGEDVELPEDCYQGEYVKDIAQSLIDTTDFDPDSYTSDEERIKYLSSFAVDYILTTQQSIMKKFRVDYDLWFRESSLHSANKVEKVFQTLEKNDYIYNDEGKMVFRSTSFNDDKDRVVIRDDGRPTYLMADIAYHNDKLERGFDKLIDIWGPDHHGYIARLSGSLQALGYEKERFQVLIAQQVNLLMNGEPVKMSKRLGQFSTMKDLIEDIGVDASRYFFVMRSMESHLDFDLDLAKKQSSENPVFYLQYAHARICSIFKKAEELGINTTVTHLNEEHLTSKEAQQLIKLIVKFPEEIQDSAEAYEVHRVASYLMKLAQQFHKFYTVNRVLTDDENTTESMLAICRASQITIRNGLGFLGVSAPETM
jgi:arginyl-tRNA synthetase